MSTRCTPGDLAVVVSALHPGNLGRIVQVIGLHDGSGDLRYPASACPVWLVKSPRRMVWRCRGKRYQRKIGPVPDSQLQPIRGDRVEATGPAIVEQARRATGAVQARGRDRALEAH